MKFAVVHGVFQFQAVVRTTEIKLCCLKNNLVLKFIRRPFEKNGGRTCFRKKKSYIKNYYKAKKTTVFSDSWLGHYFYFKLNKKSSLFAVFPKTVFGAILVTSL